MCQKSAKHSKLSIANFDKNFEYHCKIEYVT